jgi:ubiquinone/menaquinone biosynthesis C-methylase UbiE
MQVEFISQSAVARLPLPEDSIDTAVVTWSLCSIDDPLSALQEIRRVIKPDGQLIFIEHGRASDPGVVAWQDRLTPIWKHVTGGCHLNRKVDQLICAAGFQIAELRTGYHPGPRPMTYTYQGVAQLASAPKSV